MGRRQLTSSLVLDGPKDIRRVSPVMYYTIYQGLLLLMLGMTMSSNYNIKKL